jgi:hypothetical protein
MSATVELETAEAAAAGRSLMPTPPLYVWAEFVVEFGITPRFVVTFGPGQRFTVEAGIA